MRIVARTEAITDHTSQIGMAMPRDSSFREYRISAHPMLMFFMGRDELLDPYGYSIGQVAVVAYLDSAETNYIRFVGFLGSYFADNAADGQK